MTPTQISLAEKSLREMSTVSVQAPQPHDAESLSALFKQNNIVNASISLSDMTATGFSGVGLAAIDGLAKTFRPDGSREAILASNSTVAKIIGGEIITKWKGRSAASLTKVDYEALEVSINQWFLTLTQIRTHVVPCTLSTYAIPAFAVGPVTFHHLHYFPSEEFGVERKIFWPAPEAKWKQWTKNVWAALTGRSVPAPEIGGFYFSHTVRLANERHAPWMALVEIAGRAEAESIATADIATDIALAAIQLAFPDPSLRGIARATGRSAPLWRPNLWRGSDGGMHPGTSNREPARAIAPALFAHTLAQIRPSLDCMGRRLSSFLNATSLVPDLDEAWCNAAYWYHEALAETLDTVAVAKLETAIEVLFRAESMSGSKRRLLDSFDAIFGRKEHDPIAPNSKITVGQFIFSITTARSRVLHGTWPTLHTDLPGAKGQPAVTYADVELLARILLVEFASHIDEYQTAGETTDTTEALTDWIKKRREARSKAAGQSKAQP